MTKNDIKLLCEHNENLRYWAVVLFAEIYELAHKNSECRDQEAFVAGQCRMKAEEFEWQVIQEQVRQAKEKAETKPDGEAG